MYAKEIRLLLGFFTYTPPLRDDFRNAGTVTNPEQISSL